MHLQQAFETYKLNPDSVKKIFCAKHYILLSPEYAVEFESQSNNKGVPFYYQQT